MYTTGKTYRLRISNVGLQHSLNFRIQNHKMKLVEVEGTHTLQTTYSSLDVHVGQSYSVLVTADQPAQDYYVVASTRFSSKILTTTAVLRYSNSAGAVSGPPPGGPTIQVDWSLNQARSIRYFIFKLLWILSTLLFYKINYAWIKKLTNWIINLVSKIRLWTRWWVFLPCNLMEHSSNLIGNSQYCHYYYYYFPCPPIKKVFKVQCQFGHEIKQILKTIFEF